MSSPQLSMGVRMKSSSRWKNMEVSVTARHQGIVTFSTVHVCVCYYLPYVNQAFLLLESM